MIIRHNIHALKTLNNINKASKKGWDATAKLSSGLSINKAADDAAGLSISEKMRAQIRGLVQAERNGRDAQSMLDTVDGVLQEETNLLQRMRELTIQSLNDTLSESDHLALQEEFRQLQMSLDRFSQSTEWSGMPIIESHQSSFAQLEGNHYFNQIIKIVDGYNNDLTFMIDGVEKSVKIDEGLYTIGEIADQLDTKLLQIDPNIIVNVTEENTVSIQAENNKSIDSIKGGASFLFYEYSLGNPPGMVIGVTKFQDGGKVQIISGKSDTLTFYAGSDKVYNLRFSAGQYSLEEVINGINRQLESKGENSVKAIKYGEDRIALTSNKYVITGLSGNMIEIDGITSILYDNTKSGTISKSQAYITGYADLSQPIEFIKGVNDQLKVYIDNHPPVTIQFLAGDENSKVLNKQDIINKINDEFMKHGIDATANGDFMNRLQIKSNYFGANSHVVIDKQSSAFQNLFVKENVTYTNILPNNGADIAAKIQGQYGIKNTTTIKTGVNDTLKFQVDSRDFTIILDEEDYSKTELVDELNLKLSEQNIPINVKLSDFTSNFQSALIFEHKSIGTGSININPSSNAVKTLLHGRTIIDPFIAQGTTSAIYPPEGIASPPEYTYTAARAEGRTSLGSGITIDENNNKMNFTLNGEIIEITLKSGVYNRAEDFLTANNRLFEDIGLNASLFTSKTLIFETKEKGENQTFSNFGGSSHEFIMGLVQDSPPNYYSSSGMGIPSLLNGVSTINGGIIINDSNNKMSFTYERDGNSHEINFSIDPAYYSSLDSLLLELNEKIKQTLKSEGMSGNELRFEKLNDNRIQLRTAESGENNKFNQFSGGMYDEIFRKRVTVQEPYASDSGYTYVQDTYIVGRESLISKNIVIHPNINDRLLFDLHINNQKHMIDITLNAGHYNASSLIQEINQSLSAKLTSLGMFPDLVQAQIGGITSGTAENDTDKLVFKVNMQENGRNDTGSYRIDGVRGSAAYTFFYRAEGEPTPTYTIGIMDLTGTTKIEEGVNDTFILEVDGAEKKIALNAGTYDSDSLLNEINTQLNAVNANIIASYYDGRLKLSSNEVGQISIDGIRGNARGTLFYKTNDREKDEPMKFQIGANANQQITFERIRVTSELLRVNTVMIHDRNHSEKALTRIDEAMNALNKQRSYVGAVSNRLEHAINNARNYAENIIASESRIRDADLAKEMMEKIKSDILTQTSQAILSQANKEPMSLLELLK
ncbi:flagellin N-terminal helical domain-containing protein [Lederbergia panacisoli]|uniref:flagellin N-terminal helical domain-containing protein n=1 Tax=Lederbergia panacisoli TaxID=1255251 RepID=UPI00214D0C73|nr:flagellin [Lederbergia panacisoli]MCR2822366.1 flagellin [Lederbergia panacisoli]